MYSMQWGDGTGSAQPGAVHDGALTVARMRPVRLTLCNTVRDTVAMTKLTKFPTESGSTHVTCHRHVRHTARLLVRCA